VAFSPNLKATIYEAARISIFFKSKLILKHMCKKPSEKEKNLKTTLAFFLKKGLPVSWFLSREKL